MTVESFNLDTPPGFRGLHPDLPIRVYQRHLPHWRQRGATYFVTFRLADSIPQEKLRQLARWRDQWELSHPPPRTKKQWASLARQAARKIEGWLDQGHGACHLSNPQYARLMSEALLHFQGERCLTSCFGIMPNHVHANLKPLGNHELEDILKSIKQYVARRINRSEGLTGHLWEQESYDQIIRDEEHLYRIIQYIGRNFAKAGIPKARWHRWIHPDWEAAGWGFRDKP